MLPLKYTATLLPIHGHVSTLFGISVFYAKL